jgi:hypothetical protein
MGAVFVSEQSKTAGVNLAARSPFFVGMHPKGKRANSRVSVSPIMCTGGEYH